MGYEAGADDYMTKPFSLSVLLLKIEAHFRRRKNEPGTPKIHSKDIVFIPGEMRAFVKEREISLTKNELKMLSFFLQNPKQILSKTQLLENVFDLDGDFMDENTVAVNIRRLREKIEEDPAALVYINAYKIKKVLISIYSVRFLRNVGISRKRLGSVPEYRFCPVR